MGYLVIGIFYGFLFGFAVGLAAAVLIERRQKREIPQEERTSAEKEEAEEAEDQERQLKNLLLYDGTSKGQKRRAEE